MRLPSTLRSLFLASLSAAVIAAPAAAQYNPGQDTVVVTRAADGSGADINVRGSLTPSDAAVLFGITPPPSPDAILILDSGQSPRWSTETLADIDRELGGDGTVEIELFPEDERNAGPETRPAPDRAPAPSSSPSGSMQPRSGMWQAAPGAVEAVDCPSMIASNLGSFSSAGRIDTAPRRITFDQPFNPASLPGLSDQLNFDWLQMDPNTWIGSADLPGAQGMTPHMQLTVRVVSPEELLTVGVVRLNFPPQLVSTLGGGEDCRTVLETRMSRISD